jgi:RNA polymerase sigma-70 factor (ECF subfamily)
MPEMMNANRESVEAVRTFEEHRGALFGVAYRMTGSAADAEDLVQEAYLRWSRAPHGEVRSAEDYLTTVVTRLAVDHLRSARVRREEYVGPWLPEPLAGAAAEAADARVELAESLQTAFLVVLETLSPVERAAFLLREVFGHDYAYLAAVLDRSEESCRQLTHRARARVAEGRPRFQASPRELGEVTHRFVEACTGGDFDALMAVLAPDVTYLGDGGGVVQNARNPVRGDINVARLLLGLRAKMHTELRATIEPINAQPGIVFWEGGAPYAVTTLEVAEGRIVSVYVVNNPEKLAGIGAARGLTHTQEEDDAAHSG